MLDIEVKMEMQGELGALNTISIIASTSAFEDYNQNRPSLFSYIRRSDRDFIFV